MCPLSISLCDFSLFQHFDLCQLSKGMTAKKYFSSSNWTTQDHTYLTVESVTQVLSDSPRKWTIQNVNTIQNWIISKEDENISFIFNTILCPVMLNFVFFNLNRFDLIQVLEFSLLKTKKGPNRNQNWKIYITLTYPGANKSSANLLIASASILKTCLSKEDYKML
jgi:hypothetical protein